jgi:hypothetical protein
MTAEASDPGFRVSDRRRRADEDATGAESSSRSDPPLAGGSRAEAAAGPVPAGDLTGLFLMFASSAMIALGESPDPLTGEHRVNIAEARGAIDMLRLLRAKTEGNRTPEEDQLLQQIVYDLQMRFVRATARGSGRPDDRPRP